MENKDNKDKKFNFSFKRAVIISALVILVIIGAVKILFFGLLVKDRWEVIQFAFTKPQIVNAVRNSYIDRQYKLDQSFLKTEKTAEEKLIEEVANQLNETKK